MQAAARYHVLVVDDDVATSLLTRLRLESCGFQVSCALNGEDAILLLETRNIQALVVDYQLATQNGIEFFRLAVSLGFAVPAVMVTGIEDPDLEQYALEAGMHGFITKRLNYLDALPGIVHGLVAEGADRAIRSPRAAYWQCATALCD